MQLSPDITGKSYARNDRKYKCSMPKIHIEDTLFLFSTCMVKMITWQLKHTNKQTNTQKLHEAKLFLTDEQPLRCLKIYPYLHNPIAHYHVGNRTPVFPIPSQMNQSHTIPSNFLKIHFNIILSIT
jgi:hypothetical protein